MRTAETSAGGRPVATATAGVWLAASIFSTAGESHSGGGRMMPSTPEFSRRAAAASAASSSHFSTTSWMLLRLTWSRPPTRNSLR